MFGHQYQIPSDPIKEFEKIELGFGDLHIIFEEEKSGFHEGAWCLSVTDRETKETQHLIDISKRKRQAAFFQHLQNKDLPAFMAELNKCSGTGITLNWLITRVLEKYKDKTDLLPDMLVKPTERSAHPLDDANLDEKAIAIKQALHSAEGFQLGNFILHIRKPSKHSIYRHDLLYLADQDGKKVKVSIGNTPMAKVINWLKENDIASLQNYLRDRGVNGQCMASALTNQRSVPEKIRPRDDTQGNNPPRMRLGI